MSKVKWVLSVASLLAVVVVLSCSSPGGGTNDDNNSGDKLPSSSSATDFIPSSSSVVVTPTSSSSATDFIPSSSSVVVTPTSSSSAVIPTQYYVMVMGNLLNNSYCQFPSNFLGVVMPLTNELSEMANTCLVNSEKYTNLTSTQVATYLSNNNLSTYALDFDRRIAASPLNAAMLVYTNTNNYLRLLIIGYQQY